MASIHCSIGTAFYGEYPLFYRDCMLWRVSTVLYGQHAMASIHCSIGTACYGEYPLFYRDMHAMASIHCSIGTACYGEYPLFYRDCMLWRVSTVL